MHENGYKTSLQAPFVPVSYFEECKVQSNDCMRTVTDWGTGEILISPKGLKK
jgi:hypothetical protein